MNHSRIGSSRTDRVKTQSFIVLKLEPPGIYVLSSLELVDLVLLGPPGPELDLSNSVSDVTVPEALDLLIPSHCPVYADPCPFDRILKT